MKIYVISELIQLARTKSPFYKELYKDCGQNPQLQELPILNGTTFWKANNLEKNEVLTEPHSNGIVFKSGGTTGYPKFSFFTKEEWNLFTQAFGEGLTKGGLVAGEKIANLFYVGDLYASFLFIMKSLEASTVPIVHFPLGGAADMQTIIKTLKEFQIDVWAGVPTTIMKLAEIAVQEKAPHPRKILFGGEDFYPDQRMHLEHLIPGVKIQSIGYASVDGGLLGFVDPECQPGEHRVFSDHTFIEIIDEDTGQPIEEVGKVGKVILTNLTRGLMPIIRYPAGDLAAWVEPSSVKKFRKFLIQGRSEEGARVGPVTLFYDDLSQFLQKFHKDLESAGFQMIIRHFGNKDQLIIRVATTKGSEVLKEKIQKELHKERPLIEASIAQGHIHPVEFEFVEAHQLTFQLRTGKLRRLIDERF